MVEGDPLDFMVEEVQPGVVMVDQPVVDHLQTEVVQVILMDPRDAEGSTGWVEVCEEDEEVYLREV